MAHIKWEHEENVEVDAYHIYWAEQSFPLYAPPDAPITIVEPTVRGAHFPDINTGYFRVGIEVRGQIRLSTDIIAAAGKPLGI